MKDKINNIIASMKMAPVHPLEKLSETSPSGDNGYANHMRFQVVGKWRNLPDREHQPDLSHVEVYLDDFIGVVKGVTEEF